jgi:eukaryotic-like serine/threonine-protein kinase
MGGSKPTDMDAVRGALDALDGLPEGGWAARLDALGLPDAVRAEVESLLAARSRQGGFLSGSPLAADDGADGPLLSPGTRLGPFAIEDLIGRGGSAEVFQARRIDNFDQRVAIKVLYDAGRTRIGYFLRERSILASMEHPGIARIIDGGVTGNGHPYMVMEYVEGTDVIEHAKTHRLDLYQRLGLFQQICEAVAYAHRHLTIHRDLKPPNIRVTPQGQVKLLDFGVAKLLATDVRGEQFETATVLTPEFAAPEQLYGETVTTATDVYALGGVLHYLLSGEPPFDTRGMPLHLAIDKLLRSDPPQLSRSAERAAEPPVPPALLRGDLDAIVARAMRRRPAERYGSVQALWADIERFLDHRPVEARTGATTYRMSRYLRRHRFAVAAAGVVLIAVAALIAQLYRTQQIDRRARAVAEAQRAELVRLVDFQRAMFDRSDPEIIGAAFVERLRAQLRAGLGEDAERDPLTAWYEYETQLAPTEAAVHVLGRYLLDPARDQLDRDRAASPGTLARLRDALAWAYHGIGAFEDAAGQRLRAIDALRAAGAPPAQVLEQELRYAHMIAQTDRGQEASALYDRVIAGLERELGPDHRLVLEARFLQLTLDGNQRATDEVLARSRQLFDDARRALGGTDRDTLLAQQILTGNLCFHGRTAEGVAQAEHLLAVVDAHHADDDQLLMRVLGSAALCLGHAGRNAEAIEIERRNVQIHRRALGPAHPHTLNTVGNLMFALRNADRLDEAEVLGEELLQIARERDSALMRARRVAWVINLVNVDLLQGDVISAGQRLAAHLDASTQLLGSGDTRVLALRLLQGAWLLDSGGTAAALEHSRALRADFERLGHAQSALGLRARELEAVALGANGRRNEALALARALLDDTRAADGGAATPGVLQRATRVAELELALGRPQRGLELLQPLLAAYAGTPGRSLILSRAELVAAQCEIALGPAPDIAQRLLTLLDALEAAHGLRHPLVTLTASTLASLPNLAAGGLVAAESRLAWLDEAAAEAMTAEQRQVRARRPHAAAQSRL